MRDLIRQKIVDSQTAPVPPFTRRDIHLPEVPRKAIAVTGMRRAGKTTFLWQVITDRLAQGMPREGMLYFNFEDERMVNPRKVYPIDPGIIPVFDRSGLANLGHALESTVLLELLRRGAEVSYIRTKSGFEVDFLARYPAGREIAIQVCTNLDTQETRDREVRALLEAAHEFPRAELLLITLEAEILIKLPSGVDWRPAFVWLLENK